MPDTLIDAREIHASLIRNEPMQARSTARLAALLDAAAVVVDEIGYERLTTAMVAEGAGASIGTVYRYFPDRIAVLQAVAARAVERFSEKARSVVGDTKHTTWLQIIDGLLDAYEAAFRSEPAFASLRFGDSIDLRPREQEHTGLRTVVNDFAPHFASRFPFMDDEALRLRIELAFTIADAVFARAFRNNPKGDAAIIAEGRRLAREFLIEHLGDPEKG